MGKTLIITEKPSVAKDIAKVLGKFTNRKEYLENEEYYITWAVGHLITLAEPEDYEKRYKVWRLSLLPFIPDKFLLKPIDKNEKRIKVIKDLIESNEVEKIINGCDAGREGELIFRYIYEYIGTKKPFQRLWLSSMTTAAIHQSFRNLLPGEKMELLAEAAKCRSESDWLVGINGTRVFTARFKILLSVGRVQTPTLAILVQREKEIQGFKPTPYWEIFAEFSSLQGTYIGKWIDGEDRVYDQQRAWQIEQNVQGQTGKVTEFSDKKTKEQHPLLYDLTELQRDANKIFGFSAKRTLNSAQKLYETHKLITYPRTDSRFLSHDLVDQVVTGWNMLHKCGFKELTHEPLDIKNALKDRRVFDNSRVSDHHAIIPTGEKIKWEALGRDDQKIMDLICKRFLSVFYPEAIWAQRRIKTEVNNENFISKSKVLIEPGWRKVYGKEATSEESEYLPEIEIGTTVKTEKVWVEEKETKAPPRYTEASLLSAMEGAGKLVDDEELQEIMKESGLGTPATRAAIIERLIEVGYLEREEKTLIPSQKGIELINLIESIPIIELASPQLTGQWEKKLIQIEKGQFSRQEFMDEIKKLTNEIVSKVKEKKDNGERSKMNTNIGFCPLCGSPVQENRSAFACVHWKEGCPFTLWKKILGKTITRNQAQKLITQGKTDVISGFKSKKGKFFKACLVLQEGGKIGFEFNSPTPKKGDDSASTPENTSL
ncbi:MAG: DNA topoisomerase 3 [Candidatus Atribacteria bacterium]|nr:DNA topoisomerase 3 [Candidatus Atribacteria bacterium]